MSHFTVLVTGDDVEAALAPFREELEVERYQKYTKEELVAEGRSRIEQYAEKGPYAQFKADPAAYAKRCSHNPEHLNYLVNEFPERLEWTDEQVYAGEIRWYEPDEIEQDGSVWSTANPDAKWDWWTVGGRWAGGLHLKLGCSGEKGKPSWGLPADDPGITDPMRVDSARVDDLDLDATDSTFAVLHDGEWSERASMGWFGVTYDEKTTEDQWPVEWRRIVEEIPRGTTVTLVDCHI